MGGVKWDLLFPSTDEEMFESGKSTSVEEHVLVRRTPRRRRSAMDLHRRETSRSVFVIETRHDDSGELRTDRGKRGEVDEGANEVD